MTRTNVTVDDRRAVLVLAKNRKDSDILRVPQEAFIRNALKDRMGWPRREPAPEAVKLAAREMAKAIAPKISVVA